MADGISFDVSLSLNCTDCTNTEEGLRNWTLNSRLWELDSGLYAPPLNYSQEMTVASSEGDDYRYSCNLKIWIEHKYTVQIQIRLLPLAKYEWCTILNPVPFIQQ